MSGSGAVPPERTLGGRGRWAEVAAYAALAVGAGLLAALVRTLDAELPAMRALFWYAVVGAVASALLSLALAVTRRLPTLEEGTIGGRSGSVVRAWGPHWWFSRAMDLALVVLGVVLVVLGSRAATDALVWMLSPALVAAWSAGLVVLALTGRRNREALWVTEERLVHESRRGRRSVAVVDVERVWAGSRSETLLVRSERPVDVETRCPGLWGGRRPRRPDRVLAVDCSLMGHAAADLAGWLQDVVGVSATGASVAERRRRRRPRRG